MAGESPDKSVDEGAPGAAKSSAERDPRLSVFRPRDPESGTDPLREAVAAWVATSEPESSGRVDSESDSSEAPRSPKPDSASAPAPAKTATPAPADKPAEPAEPTSAGTPADEGERTAVFRAVKPGSASASAKAGADAATAAKPG
ncbi:hypothetical protein ACFCWL_20710, partial [Streptomyces sp. NPDC056387]